MLSVTVICKPQPQSVSLFIAQSLSHNTGKRAVSVFGKIAL